MIRIRKNNKGQFWVQYIAKNGKILANSETLTTKQAVFKNIRAMRQCCLFGKYVIPVVVDENDNRITV